MCPKAFAQPQSLANHMERHQRVKDTHKRFLCEVCSKCFAQSGSLIAHMRTHTGVKPYVCKICSRAFTKSTYLQLHCKNMVKKKISLTENWVIIPIFTFSEDSQWREALYLPILQHCVRSGQYSGQAHHHAHGRGEVQLPSVLQVLQATHHSERAQLHAHRVKALRLQDLRQELQQCWVIVRAHEEVQGTTRGSEQRSG